MNSQHITKIMIYKCDRCHKEHELDESKVKNKQHYVSPSGCYEGDYYVDDYYWFKCDCSRPIEVKKEHLSNPFSVEEDFTPHIGVCPFINKD